MDINTDNELCAALKNNDTIPVVVYKKEGNKFKKFEEKKESVVYYGGSDACQGDSGGPL